MNFFVILMKRFQIRNLFQTKGTNLEDREYDEIINNLKFILRQKGVGYKQLSQDCGIPLSTLKKIFSGRDASLKKLIKICRSVNISFLDLLEVARHNKKEHIFEFTQEIEDFFVKNATYFLFFHKVYHEKRMISEAQKELGLDDLSAQKIIKKLISMKLIKSTQGDRLIFNLDGGVKYLESGPLNTLILKKSSQGLLNYLLETPDSNQITKDPFIRLNFSYVTESTFKRLVASLTEIHNDFAVQSIRDRRISNKEDLIQASWILGLGPCNAIEFINQSLLL